MTTLCLDAGNSLCKIAIFKNADLITLHPLKTCDAITLQPIIEKYQPSRSILCSVTNNNEAAESLLQTTTHFHKLSAASKLNFNMATAKSTGTDRLALAAAAAKYFPNTNLLVISLGTCITYNFINQSAVFLGGAISPGLNMRFQALHHFTAKLPEVKEQFSIPLTGYDTPTAIQSGVVNGIIAELHGFIADYEALYGNFNVVLTGGNSGYFATRLKKRIFADFNFLFKGLYALSEINCS